MKTRNILKLFTTFSALFLINGVKAATLTEIPKCDTANSNSKYGGYCLNDEKLKKYTNGSEDTTTITEGLHFILNGCDDELSAAQTSASPVFLVNVTTNKDVVETISKGYYLDNANNIVNCISETKCIFYDTTSVPSGCPSFLIQNPLSGKSLIKIDGTTISDTEIKDGYYVSANVPQLIQCRNNDCKEVSASVTNVYIDAAGEANSLIKCVDGVTGSIQCKSELITSDANFINSGELDKATKPIIKCTSTKCEASEITESNVYYQDTMEGSKVIHCTPGKCTKVDGAGGDVYVAKKDGEGETDGIIVCTDDDSGNITCIPPTSIATDSYYLNAGSDASTNQVISCDNGCKSVKVNPGYYKNANSISTDDVLLECVNECKPIANIAACPSEDVAASQACTSNGSLVFLEKNTNNTEHVYSSSDLYVYTSVNNFPSISNANGVTTLFRISKFGVERYISSGVVAVSPSSHQLVTDANNSVIGTDVDLYDCNNTSTKICAKRATCTPNTYMFDSENAKAIYCDGDEKLVDVSATAGFYVDTTTTIGTRAPYIIACDNGVCEHVLPTVASYFKNAGYDNETKALIYCNGSTCATTAANTGNYIANQQAGIIVCSSQEGVESLAALSLTKSSSASVTSLEVLMVILTADW